MRFADKGVKIIRLSNSQNKITIISIRALEEQRTLIDKAALLV
jgi:hypothetical protein